jgi:hypothetical protein
MAKLGKVTKKALLTHGQKPNFWKPKAEGEKIAGKLLGIKTGKYGLSLRIQTLEGSTAIAINDYLKDLDFGPLIGKVLEFVYIETVGKGLRIYDVFEIEDTPF